MKKVTKTSDKRRVEYIKTVLKKDKKDLLFCILGAGHGGLAMAGHLGIMGFRVNLYNRGRRRILPVIHRGGIKVEGEVKGFGKIDLASTNMKECMEEADVLMVVVPALAHSFIAETCAPYLKENQIDLSSTASELLANYSVVKSDTTPLKIVSQKILEDG